MKIFLNEEVNIEVATVKKMFATNFLSPLWKKVLAARKSYLAYGNVPLTDHYDKKSIIFLARAQFPVERKLCKEYITMRMFPLVAADDETPWSEEVEMFIFEKGGETYSVYEMFAQKHIKPTSVASISRLGSIKAEGMSRNKYIAESFAAVQLEMCDHARKLGIEWIVSQQHRALVSKTLARDGKVLKFTPAKASLHLTGGNFRLKREDPFVWNYMLSYPGYFFELVALRKVLAKFFGSEYEHIERYNVKTLIPKIFEDKILQKVLRSEVPDGVFLSLVKLSDWEQSSKDLLEYAKNDYKLQGVGY